MITIRKNTVWNFRVASWILLCILQPSTAAALDARPAKIAIAKRINARLADVMARVGFRNDREKVPDAPARHIQNVPAQGSRVPVRHLKFSHLTTNDGLSQGYVTAILQDRRGFMWFATRDGLNRYDGNTFVVYKNNPNDPTSLSSNFIQALMEDDHGDLWIATNTGVNRFDPTIERFSRHVHDPYNPNSIGGAYVTSIAPDNRGYIWFGTEASGPWIKFAFTYSHVLVVGFSLDGAATVDSVRVTLPTLPRPHRSSGLLRGTFAKTDLAWRLPSHSSG